MALPSPFKQCWNEETLLGQGKVYSPAQTTTLLGGWRKRGEIKADHVKRPKSFVPHYCSRSRFSVENRSNQCVYNWP